MNPMVSMVSSVLRMMVRSRGRRRNSGWLAALRASAMNSILRHVASPGASVRRGTTRDTKYDAASGSKSVSG